MPCLVLVVDDIDQCRELACKLVSALGYRSLGADCGTSAIALIKNMSPHDRVVLLTDYFLPDANGVELCRLAKNLGGATILCSGDPDMIEEFNRDDGIIDAVLEKPYSLGELRNVLEYAVTSVLHLRTGISVVETV
jgi:CheY-like chemotaxis protein